MKPNNRLGTISVGNLILMLTPRDLEVLRSIREYKFMTTRQIYALHFSKHASYTSGIRACTRVLARLLERKLLYHLARPVGGEGGGSRSFVWGIGPAGDRLLRADPDSDHDRRFRPYEPAPLFLAHTLAIVDVRIRLQAQADSGAFELIKVVTEPSNWHPFTSRGQALVLKPDLYVVTATEDEEWHRYVEVDRGTESLQVVLKKCRLYEDYRSTAIDVLELGVVPQVIWIVPTPQRAARLLELIRSDRDLDEQLFRVITDSELEAEFNEISDAPIELVPDGSTN